jgi:hypothetical protein
MDQSGALPLELALSSVLAARLDGAARPALLAAVRGIPAQRCPDEDGPEVRMVERARTVERARMVERAQERRS